MCAYAFNCCPLLCVLSLFSFLLTLAPPPSLCCSPSPTRPPFSGSRLPLDCADLPLIALRCLVCFGKSKKRKAIKKRKTKKESTAQKNRLPHIGWSRLTLFFTGLPLPFQKKCVWWLALLYSFVHIISLWVSPEKKKKRKKGQRRKQTGGGRSRFWASAFCHAGRQPCAPPLLLLFSPFSDFLCYPPTNYGRRQRHDGWKPAGHADTSWWTGRGHEDDAWTAWLDMQ